jgi:hypothetical protein
MWSGYYLVTLQLVLVGKHRPGWAKVLASLEQSLPFDLLSTLLQQQQPPPPPPPPPPQLGSPASGAKLKRNSLPDKCVEAVRWYPSLEFCPQYEPDGVRAFLKTPHRDELFMLVRARHIICHHFHLFFFFAKSHSPMEQTQALKVPSVAAMVEALPPEAVEACKQLLELVYNAHGFARMNHFAYPPLSKHWLDPDESFPHFDLVFPIVAKYFSGEGVTKPGEPSWLQFVPNSVPRDVVVGSTLQLPKLKSTVSISLDRLIGSGGFAVVYEYVKTRSSPALIHYSLS